MPGADFFIRPSSDMAGDYIAERHRAVVEGVMTALAGRPLSVVCTGGEEAAAPAPSLKAPPDYPAPVAALLEVAGDGARVEEVTSPAPPRAAEKKPAPPQQKQVEEDDCETYEPTPDEEAEMYDDELPPDAQA